MDIVVNSGICHCYLGNFDTAEVGPTYINAYVCMYIHAHVYNNTLHCFYHQHIHGSVITM